MAPGASLDDAGVSHARTGVQLRSLQPLRCIEVDQWRDLSQGAIEPNGYYLPDWALAVNASARGRMGVSALVARDDDRGGRLVGLMPVVSLWQAFRIPLPALISAQPYGTLCTPLIERGQAETAVTDFLQGARAAGARALILRDTSLEGEAMRMLTNGAVQAGLHPRILQSHRRAWLDATGNPETVLRDALGRKKLNELRRQRHRLAQHGAVRFEVARNPEEVATATETFLALEASGWKGKRGTALLQNAGDATFIRRATVRLAARGQCEVVSLHCADTPVAAGIVLRHSRRAFFFKLGFDERFAKHSPGVQLTLELTRHLCSDPDIVAADSTASPDHPMIDPIWRGRLAIGDVLIPLRRNDPIVTLIHAALLLRDLALTAGRYVRRLLRGRR
jgi:CelD/BcsL family acetyltransferase involved in cellulose biosynthesis